MCLHQIFYCSLKKWVSKEDFGSLNTWKSRENKKEKVFSIFLICIQEVSLAIRLYFLLEIKWILSEILGEVKFWPVSIYLISKQVYRRQPAKSNIDPKRKRGTLCPQWMTSVDVLPFRWSGKYYVEVY